MYPDMTKKYSEQWATPEQTGQLNTKKATNFGEKITEKNIET